MIQQLKTQTPQQNAAQVKQLEMKLKTTSEAVQNIISNFEAVHGEMNDLKQEYIQSLEESKQADS